MKPLPFSLAIMCTALIAQCGADGMEWVKYEGKSGTGSGKHIVLVSGDEEYRSEECLPMLGRILAERHGFTCTVLFAIDSQDGTIAPEVTTNIPGLSALCDADLMVLFTRFRTLPDEQMKNIDAYVNSGKPLIGIRTATHAFAYPPDSASRYKDYDWRSESWPGGFGRQVLGETWVAHHGDHGTQSTRGIVNPPEKNHPILTGVEDVWGPTDVYTVRELPPDSTVLMHGQVLSGMEADDPPAGDGLNEPMMPLVWLRQYEGKEGSSSAVLCSTIGSGTDFENEGLRRLIVNAAHHLLELDVPEIADVRYVGDYEPRDFGFGKFQRGVRPEDLKP